MAELVATMVVGPLLSMVKDKASSYLLDQYKVMEGMEEQHEILKRKLPAILDIITDAEQAATHREGVKAWLEAIKKVAYEANEAFDEFKYEALRRQAKKNGHYNKLGFHVVKLFPTHNRFAFREKMGNKLCKIVQAIDVLVAEMNAFQFKYQQQAPASKQWRQTDHVMFDPKKIISRSRDQDKEKIVDILVGQASNADLMVIPIVAMGGLGKTTLAQLVYNQPEIQKHFNLLIWVCVSDSFDVDSLAKIIVEAAPDKKDGTGAAPDKKDGTGAAPDKKNGTGAAPTKKNPLDRLQDAVSGQRYLLVLDDVWNREADKWEKLKARLQHGGAGSAVLTTTRDEGVAKIMGTVRTYNLTSLEDNFIKEIIETRAFSLHKEEERPPFLVNMVGEIVKRCRGSPLAATALGSVLHTKTTEEEWKAISARSNICTEETGILPILKLSYNDLPSHMKQCFAFCAVFPKDYEIDVDKLIQLWISHGFIQEQKEVRLETIGQQIFDELASRLFFQDVKQVQVPVEDINRLVIAGTRRCYSRTTCKIHDLMHDVALSVMEKECAVITQEQSKIERAVASEEPGNQIEWLLNTVRHLFLSCEEPEMKLNNSLENSSPAIQTLLCDSQMKSSLYHPSKYSSLQALQLCSKRRSFLLKPKHLHHLRYLDLSGSRIRVLPEDITIMYNLQMLNLSGCYKLHRLPRQMKYMTALRRLYTHGCPNLKSMPPGLAKLTSLNTLTCFVAGTGSDCSNVSELQNLKLGGVLELDKLENVREEDAEKANLGKKDITDLALRWSRGGENDAKVLERLEPNGSVKAVRIVSFGGTDFPTWLAMLQNMVEIHIFWCRKLRCLYSCGTSFTFPSLKEITLHGLSDLEVWWEVNNGVQGEEIMFPQLEKLFIIDCGKLTALPGQPTSFPNLQNVCIQRCPELTTRVKSPKLDALEMHGCEEEMLQWVARHMTSLTTLTLRNHEDTETTSKAADHSFNEVMDGQEKFHNNEFVLTVMELDGLKSSVAKLCTCFVQLQDLSIVDCDALVHWPEKEFQSLVSLRKLYISRCKNLTGYAQAAPAEPSTWTSETSNQLLPRLESLEIWACESLVEVFNVPAASMRRMRIYYCSKVESISGWRRRLQQQDNSEPIQGPSLSSAAVTGEHLLPPFLESVYIGHCDSLTGALHLSRSLKLLSIDECPGLTSLVESHSGELPSLERLFLEDCKTLSSIPDGSQAYSSLQELTVRNCPGIKTLPTCLEQRLSSIEWKLLDARYEGPRLLKPWTWKYASRRD